MISKAAFAPDINVHLLAHRSKNSELFYYSEGNKICEHRKG